MLFVKKNNPNWYDSFKAVGMIKNAWRHCFSCHSVLDTESGLWTLDSRFRGNDTSPSCHSSLPFFVALCPYFVIPHYPLVIPCSYSVIPCLTRNLDFRNLNSRLWIPACAGAGMTNGKCRNDKKNIFMGMAGEILILIQKIY